MSKKRLWCFTWNNYTDSDVESVKNWKCTWLLFGKEVAPTTGTPHLQGVVYWPNARVIGGLKKLGAAIHWTACNGTADQNAVYCSKDATDVFEKGTRPAQGERTDLNAIKDRIVEGERVDDIIMENPMMGHMYGRTFDRIEDINMRKLFRTEQTTGIWLWGPTGVGKSHSAFENYSPATHYVWPNDGKWWDSYRQQDTVIFNDFRGELPYAIMLQLIDKWPMTVPRRNREPMPFISKHVIITSSLPPQDIYRNRDAEDSLAQLLRRIVVISMPEKFLAQKCSGGNTVPLSPLEITSDDDDTS